MNIIDPKLQWARSIPRDNKPSFVVVHHALHPNCTIQDVHRWHLGNGWPGCGYHYFVSREGEIFKGRDEDMTGAHSPRVNSTSIGICLEGCYQDYVVNGRDLTQKDVPQVQLNALLWLVEDIQKRYRIPLNHVRKHNFYSSKLCPGNYFPWTRFISLLQAPAAPAPAPTPAPAPVRTPSPGKSTDSFRVIADGRQVITLTGWNNARAHALKNFPNAKRLVLQNVRTQEIFALTLDPEVPATPVPRPTPPPSIRVGSRVRVNNGAKTFTGSDLSSHVYTTVYTVISMSGNRVVIGINGVVTAAINIRDLRLA